MGFFYEQNVWVLVYECLKSCGEVEVFFMVYLVLGDVWQGVFDWVFDCGNVDVWIVVFGEE